MSKLHVEPQETAARTIDINTLPLVLTTTMVAEICGVSPTTVRKWIKAGYLTPIGIEGDYRVGRKTLLDFIDGSAA
jgi:hypothetical protein